MTNDETEKQRHRRSCVGLDMRLAMLRAAGVTPVDIDLCAYTFVARVTDAIAGIAIGGGLLKAVAEIDAAISQARRTTEWDETCSTH